MLSSFRQAIDDELRGLMLLERQLGMGVKMTSPGHNITQHIVAQRVESVSRTTKVAWLMTVSDVIVYLRYDQTRGRARR